MRPPRQLLRILSAELRVRKKLKEESRGKMSSSSKSEPANKLETVKKAVHDLLHEKNSFTYLFELAEKYTKVNREYLFLGE